ncbi:MAG: DUF3157 family protein [Gammaproteobacteria bacterium]|nr:DUF3157 family protein [Gammaproteobacteria bacterium]
MATITGSPERYLAPGKNKGRHRSRIRLFVLIFLLCQPALAVVEVVTPDGQRVQLNDDHTWEYVSPDSSQKSAAAGPPKAVLRVSHVDEMDGDACRLGVILRNDLPYKIKNLSFRFSVYKSASLSYDSKTRSFFEIKSTDQQYRKLFFSGISCSDIHHIKVEDPGHCSMGELDRFSTQPGDCIKHIKVERSDLINIFQ